MVTIEQNKLTKSHLERASFKGKDATAPYFNILLCVSSTHYMHSDS